MTATTSKTTEQWPVEKLKPYAHNPRTHSDDQIEALRASMREFGWTMPILADARGNVIAGHGRLMAAKLEGMQSVPVIVARGWSAAQKRAYIIADNRLTERGGWNEELLKTEFISLREMGIDIHITGFLDEDFIRLGIDPDPNPPKVSLSDRFGIPPFTVLNAREGWWQDRKRAWLALGIQSELGRGEESAPGGAPMPMDRKKMGKANATPGGAAMPAADYSKNRARGDGRGRAIANGEK